MKIKTLFFLILGLCIVNLFFHPGIIEAKILNKELVNKVVLAAGYSASFCPINLGDTPLNEGDFSSGLFKYKESYPCIGNNEEVRFGQVTLYLRQNSEETPPKAIENVVLFGEDIFRLDSVQFIYYPNTNTGGTFFAGGGNENEIVKGLEIVKSTTLHRTDPNLPFGQEKVPNSEMSTHYDLGGNIDGMLFRLAGKAYKLVTINNKVYDKVLVDYTIDSPWRTFTSSDNSFAFKYPSDWFVQSEEIFGSRLVVEIRYKNNPIMTISLIANYNQVTGKPYQSLTEFLDTAGAAKSKAIVIDQVQASRISEPGGDHATPSESLVLFSKDLAKIIWLVYNPGFYPQDLIDKPFDQILSTFKFIDKSSITQTVTLKVTQLKTGFGIGGVTPTYPPSVTVSVPQSFSDQIDAYGVLHATTLIGPKGWTGDGMVGADGSSTANLYPVGGSAVNGSRIIVRVDPACIGCIYDGAAPYFPKARQLAKEVFNMDIPEEPDLVSNFVTPQLLRYSLPNTSDGLEVNGIAYFTESVSPQLSAQPYFIGMEITLPPQQHDLAILLLDIFIQRENLSNK